MNQPFWELERAAAARSRGLDSPFDWPFLIEAARELALLPFDADEPAVVARHQFSPRHFAAARILDNAAQFAPQKTPAQTRHLGLWAAAAFAQSGNFPSATVTARRTFVRRSGHDPQTAALLCAVAPALATELRAEAPVATHLSEFLRSGDDSKAELARQVWQNTLSEADETFPPPLWELASRGLEAALCLSTAHALHHCGATFPEGFIAKVAARVPVLLPPQAQALEAGVLNGDGNALAALSPGSGKTLLGELFLASCLGGGTDAGPRWAVFVVPYVALGRGVVSAAKAHLPSGVTQHHWLGGAREEDDTDLSSGLHVVVATPERLDAYLRRHPEAWQTLRGVVCDEAHLVGDGSRGARLEGLITRLLLRKEQIPARLLMLSAALGDFTALSRWINAEHVLSSPWTPTARRLAFWRGDGRLEWHGDLAGRGLEPLGETRLAPLHPHIQATEEWPKIRRLEPRTRENVAQLTHHLYEERGGPILCLCATRRTTRELAFALSEWFPVSTELSGHRATAIEAIEARHRTLLPLAELLKRGVAWHNSSLPQEVRAAIEAGVSAGEIAVVAATSTLAEGVDLPFRLTVLADWLTWNDGGQQPISPAMFRNIAGRCGRAGAFTEGDTLIFDNPLGDRCFTAPDRRAGLQHELYLSGDLGIPGSALEMKEQSDGARGAVEATFETQLLAALGESEHGEDFLEQFLATTYLSHSHPPSLEQWKERGELCLNRWAADGLLQREPLALTPRGKAWRASDLSPATCRRLLGALETLPSGDYSGVKGLTRLNAYLWRALGGVPEAGAEIGRFFQPRSRFVATPADLEALGALWLRGISAEAIFAALPRVKRSAHAGLDLWVDGMENEAAGLEISPQWSAEYERWLDFVRAGLESWTPWLWRASAILAPLAGGAATKIDWRSGSALWSAGVDTRWASRARASGAPGTRGVLAALGRAWPFESTHLARDPLALAPLRQDAARQAAETALETALREVGGRHCVAGRNMLALRDWVWGKAGLSK